MTGKLLAAMIVLSAVLAGGAMYYLQVYGYYDEVSADAPGAQMRLTTLDGVAEEILAEDVTAIDSNSSPIRFRACFTTPMSTAMLTETYQTYEGAEPLVAPDWFDCFDAAAIGHAIEAGAATAFLGEGNVSYGIDRVVAVYPDGRGFAWHQINACGEKVFDGEPAPEGCPPVPERMQ